MNLRPWHDETTLPLVGVDVARAFRDTQAEVHFTPWEGRCSACLKGECPTREACQLPVARATKPPRAAFWAERFGRQRWLVISLAVALGAVICAVCTVGYYGTSA